MINFYGIDIPLMKRVLISLTYIYGIGVSVSKKICNLCNIDYSKKAFDLKNFEINCLKNKINNYIIGDNLKILVRSNIRKLINIKCYRGSRHSKNLPVRGQRTRKNSRTRKGPKKIFFKKNEFKKI